MNSIKLNSISIFGCGWLGLSLAEALVEKGYAIKGSTTTPEKLDIFQKKGIEAFLLDFKEEYIPSHFLKSDVWIIAFPPRSKQTDGTWYWQAMSRIRNLSATFSTKKVIMLSSTSVYPDADGNMTEEIELREATSGNPSIFKAERLILDMPQTKSYVLRLGGLAGYDRLLARHFAGKTDLKNGNDPVNLLHRDDAVAIISEFVEKDFNAGIYNICSPVHPTRKELYTHDCLRFGMPLPYFIDDLAKGKVISADKILKHCTFRFPNPMDFDYSTS